MAWTAPRTWVTAETVTAALLNTHVRDNLLALQPSAATVATSQTTTSTSYTDLATTGPAVTLTTGTSALVTITCQASNSTNSGGAVMSYAVSGASSVAADDTRALWITSPTGGNIFGSSVTVLHTGLTAGSNTFTAKYKQALGTATIKNRSIIVESPY